MLFPFNIPSVNPTEVRSEVTGYQAQTDIFIEKQTETTAQRNCISDRGHWNHEQKTRQGRDGRPLDNEVKTMKTPRH